MESRGKQAYLAPKLRDLSWPQSQGHSICLSNPSDYRHTCAEKAGQQGNICVGSVPGGSLWAAWGVYRPTWGSGQLWFSRWACDGRVPVGIPQPLLPKTPAGPPAPPWEALTPGSISQPSTTASPGAGEEGDERGDGSPLGPRMADLAQSEAASILAKLWSWCLLTLPPHPGFCWVGCRQFQ